MKNNYVHFTGFLFCVRIFSIDLFALLVWFCKELYNKINLLYVFADTTIQIKCRQYKKEKKSSHSPGCVTSFQYDCNVKHLLVFN